MLKRAFAILGRVLLATLLVSLVVIVTQDLQIFPGVNLAFWTSKVRDPATLPTGVESFYLGTADGESLEVWKLRGAGSRKISPRAAIVFHGNAGTIAAFFSIQRWLASMGLDSFAVEYRGFGNSTGWPSEWGFRLDAQAIWHYLQDELALKPEELLVVGISIGTGPAAYLAKIARPAGLVLLSPFTSLRDVAAELPLMGLLSPFLLHELPVDRYLAELDSTHVIACHGVSDAVIPFEHTLRLEGSYRGRGTFTKLIYPGIGHNDILAPCAIEAGPRLAELLPAR